MQESAKQVTPLYPTPAGFASSIKIGGRSRRSQPERPVRPMHVVVLHVDAQHLVQVFASRDQQPVQALGADRANPAFREGVGVGCLDWCQHHLGVLGAEEVIEGAAEFGIPIAQDELDSSSLLAQHQQQIPCLLGDPGAVGVGGDASQMDLSGVHFDENSTYSRLSHTVSTVKKSQARIPAAC